ncbi:MAG: thermonuclease family protein [Thermoleophilia bacterium]
MPLLRGGLLAACLAFATLAGASHAAALTLRGTVSDVVDGDTIKVISRGFETPVRLIGIDTPETRAPGKPVQCFGPAASARTKRLLPVGQKVRLVTDQTQDTRDRYGRLLAYVFKAGRSGATGSVNYSLVRSGHAKVYVYGGVRFQYAVPFFKAQNRAKRAKRGLWGPPCRGNTTKADPNQPPSSPTPPAPAPGEPTDPNPAEPRAGCDPNYTGACIPPYPPDLDCGEIPDRNFRSVGSDPHNFDVDHDGIACEE